MLDKILSQHPTIYKYDRMWIGVILGLTVPLFGIVMVYLLSVFNHFAHGSEIIPIPSLIKRITSLVMLSKFLSVGCILNLGVFFIFINRDYFNISRGVILATLIVSLPVIGVTIQSWIM